MEQIWSLGRTFGSSHGKVWYDSKGDDPPLLLVHGTPWSSYARRNIAPISAETHPVYVSDLVGNGPSET